MERNKARDLYAQARRKSLAVPCEIIRVIQYEIDSGEAFYSQELKIVKGNDLTKTCIGKHLIDPSEFELESAIECAMRDGFERIYVYGGAK